MMMMMMMMMTMMQGFPVIAELLVNLALYFVVSCFGFSFGSIFLCCQLFWTFAIAKWVKADVNEQGMGEWIIFCQNFVSIA